MALQQSTDHIHTTHIGSLPRPHKLLDILKAKYGGQPYDTRELDSILTQTVADCVRKQVECGIEIVTNGEYSKPGFFTTSASVSMGSNLGPIRSSFYSSRRFPPSRNIMPSTSRKR